MPPKSTTSTEPSASKTTSPAAGSTTSTKRKRGRTNDGPPPKARRSKRNATPSDPLPIIHFLLSDKALALASTVDEEKGQKAYLSSDLSPWENLLSAMVLAKPLSHKLGQRTIRTLLNPPFAFNSPEAVRKAGVNGVHKGLEMARTQHRQKTAQQLHDVAEWVIDKFDGDLGKIREQCRGDVGLERRVLEEGIKGMGPTGLDIFQRRMQVSWDEYYPFADAKSLSYLEELGVRTDVGGLKDAIDKLKKGDHGRRQAFATVVEMALGVGLEGKVEEARELAKA